jgi:hypothetical protein
MKTLYKIVAILILGLSASCVSQMSVSAQGEDVSFQVFYDQLSPYGNWIDYPEYGYVWIPEIGQDFIPYETDGYWIMTVYGWTWISGYPWGWAPFHYGRWDYDDTLGWFWVPGTEWGPAWVVWRRADYYLGWAPMRPGISINLSFNGGYSDNEHWCFVPDRYFGRQDIDRYYVPRRDEETIIRNSAVINNTYYDNRRHTTYVAGPRVDEVQRLTGRRITAVTVRDRNNPGHKIGANQLSIYRPRFSDRGTRGERPIPPRVTNRGEIRPFMERNNSPQTRIAPSPGTRREENSGQQQRQFEPRRQEQVQHRSEPGRNFEIQRPESQNFRQEQPGVSRRQEQPGQFERHQMNPGQQQRMERQVTRSQQRFESQQRRAGVSPSENSRAEMERGRRR